MNLAWTMAVAVGVCNSGVALASKGAERHQCRAMPFSLAAFGVAGLTAFLTTLGGKSVWADPGLWAFGGAMGALYLAATAAMLRANRCWPPSLVWSAANMAFVLPILLCALFLDEPLRWLDGAILSGVAIMLFGLVERKPPGAAAGDGSERMAPPRTHWLWLGLVFALNGALMMAYKLFGAVLPGRDPSCLVTVIYGSGFAMAVAFLAFRGERRLRRVEAGWGLAVGTASGLSALAMLVAMRLPAGAAFPVIQGTSLAGGVLLCAIAFRETLMARKVGALAVGIGAMVLTAWR